MWIICTEITLLNRMIHLRWQDVRFEIFIRWAAATRLWISGISREYFQPVKCWNDSTGALICSSAEIPFCGACVLGVAETSRCFHNSWDGNDQGFSEWVQVELPEEETTENLPGYRAPPASRKPSWSPYWAPCLLSFPLHVFSPFIFYYNGTFNLAFPRLQSIYSYTLKEINKWS